MECGLTYYSYTDINNIESNLRAFVRDVYECFVSKSWLIPCLTWMVMYTLSLLQTYDKSVHERRARGRVGEMVHEYFT